MVRPPTTGVSAPARVATLAELTSDVDAWSKAIHTFKATVQYNPTAGSAYTGVIHQYRDVHGFILFERPSLIRMIGQAPVVRTDIFDMVSNGKRFSLSIPPKRKFIVGSTRYRAQAKNSLENIRPEHVTEALLIAPIDASAEKYFRTEEDKGGERYYVLDVVAAERDGQLRLLRKIWFDRADLEIHRLELYDRDGTLIEDVRYADYAKIDQIRYPLSIEVRRPMEDYTLGIVIQKISFNSPVAPGQFDLKKPPGFQLIELGGPKARERNRGL